MKQLLTTLVVITIVMLACKKEKKTVPALTTTAATNVTANSITTGGNITDDGNSGITKRGVAWATHTAPTVGDSITNDGTGTGSFATNLAGLNANTTYYLRAYAINASGTGYGNEVSVKTSNGVATITTTAISNIQPLSAVSGGSISNDGGASITERGVVYATTASPTTSNFKIVSGTGTGSFTATLSPLASQQAYYVRAYAVNSYGTAYGNQIQFSAASANTVTDIDGNVYPYIQICGKNWTTTNLKTTRFKNGDTILNGYTSTTFNWYSNQATVPAYTFPDSNVNNNSAYGKYYNRATILDSRGVCPAGWHVPSDDEWKSLESCLGMSTTVLDDVGSRGSIAPQLVTGGSSGLNLQYSGYLFFGAPGTVNYLDLTNRGLYWTSTTLVPSGSTLDYTWYRLILKGDPGVDRQYVRRYAMSIRCVKD